MPAPPMFTPISSSRQLAVNCDSSIAEGTLLMNWQDRALTSRVFLLRRAEKKERTPSMRDILPANIKKKTKVKSRG